MRRNRIILEIFMIQVFCVFGFISDGRLTRISIADWSIENKLVLCVKNQYTI